MLGHIHTDKSFLKQHSLTSPEKMVHYYRTYTDHLLRNMAPIITFTNSGGKSQKKST